MTSFIEKYLSKDCGNIGNRFSNELKKHFAFILFSSKKFEIWFDL